MLRANIIRTALCWIVWHNVHSPQHTYVSSSYRLGLSHWDPYAVHRGGCLELYYCNMVEWFRWYSSLILTTTGFLQCFDTVGLVIWPEKIVPEMTYNVSSGTLNPTHSPWNDLLCVEWDVKPYTLSHSLWNDLLCVEWDVKPYTLTHSLWNDLLCVEWDVKPYTLSHSLWNDLLCVECDVKPYTLTHSLWNDLLCVECDVKPYTLTHTLVLFCLILLE